MRRIIVGLLSAVLAVGGISQLAGPTQAASPKVNITNSARASIGWAGTATVRPKFKKAKGVTIKKATVSAKKAGRYQVRNKPLAKLAPGTYSLTVKVTYRYKGKTSSVSKTKRLKVVQGECATRANYASLVVGKAPGASFADDGLYVGNGDTSAVMGSKLHQESLFISMLFGLFGLHVGTKTLPEWREVFADPALQMSASELAEQQAHIDGLIAVYGATAKYDFAYAERCGSSDQAIRVEFIGPKAIAKAME